MNANAKSRFLKQDVRTAVGNLLGTRRAAAGLHGHLAGCGRGPGRGAARGQHDGERVPLPHRRVYQSSRRKMVRLIPQRHSSISVALLVCRLSDGGVGFRPLFLTLWRLLSQGSPREGIRTCIVFMVCFLALAVVCIRLPNDDCPFRV